MKKEEQTTENEQLRQTPVSGSYNLSFWQKVELPFLWLYWKLSVADNKKSWHEVKKGMEPHKHNYTKIFKKQGVTFAMCDHEGCTDCDILHDEFFDNCR